ncbi:methyltransferase family protein [Maribacter sp. HTCC2170]|uniref:methyltransferase family protein n=1 Tax=Maribacter sp. (strain HTCC2170 / KCCM 42371) TaxID=313603 RepID=UPI00006B47EE|nr:isoprenylcysteine carboxylmethyltransferase family protein [Maribacter sp. HTCC2170]EAR01581.1 hypothetical protein FB2170_13673 [Maribacter sp. HTCC2170]
MKLRIPPVLVFVIFSSLMYLLSRFLPFGNFEFFGRVFIIFFLLVIATIVAVFSLVQFFSSKTTVDPRKPDEASVLVVNGIYKYTRNPMYLALLLVLLAWGIWLGNAFNTILAAGFVAYMNKFQIFPEEEALAYKFPKDYRHYCTQVRRWF